MQLPRFLRRRRRLSLALQGGGAHGAFTWGVLDRLLEERGLDIEAISGASAGACNAVLLAQGWLDGGREGAKAALDGLWRSVAEEADRALPLKGEMAVFALGLAVHLFSPYQLNPTDINPLRRLLLELVDFERLRRESPFKLLIGATNLRTGRGRVFLEHELDVEMVLASACLPQLHHAVEIDGEPYWDGGFTSNPPLLALIERTGACEIVLVRINPVETALPAHSAAAIRNRVSEIIFDRPLSTELEQLSLARSLARGPVRWLSPALRRLARARVHLVDGDETLSRLHPSTRLIPRLDELLSLRDAGREAAEAFLSERSL